MRRWFRRWFTPVQPPVLPSLQAYQQWAGAYPPHAHNALMQAEEEAMRSLLPTMAGRTILDLACGSGRYALIAHQLGAGRVIALDNSEAMLRVSSLMGVACATTEAIPLANQTVDGIICGLALGHLPRLEPTFHEMGRVLKPGGWLLLSDVHPFIFLNGAQRTFQAADGRTYAVEHYPHLIADYQTAGQAVELYLEALAEPGLQAGVVAPVTSTVPVALVLRWRKSE
jgi:malonyl-CoA O-methyltransferase